VIRIISGTHKGRRLQAPRNLPVRPTTDRSKEALFNILANRMDWASARVLDLFAGTGNISYECASRGCLAVTAVDAHPGCVAFIEKTAEQLDMPIQALRQDALRYLERNRQRYDLIFADPPYSLTEAQLAGLVETCLSGQHLAPGGVLVVEHIRQTDLSGLPGFQEARRYGQSVFSFFEPR
jgi:16S rRNA (guanine(966)-N(2))-methyltransferase RsmD